MAGDEKASLLRDEYLQIQKIIEDFDAKSLTIKAWSVTLSAAALVAAYAENAPFALLVGSGSAVAFWIVEALWKAMQQAFYARQRSIEAWMRNDGDEVHPLQITTAWHSAWQDQGRARKALGTMAWPHVFMPHLAVALAGLLLFLFAPPA